MLKKKLLALLIIVFDVKMSNDVFAKTLKKHAKEHARRDTPTLKDTKSQFRNGPFCEKAN